MSSQPDNISNEFFEALMAQSLYEPLSEAEQQRLDAFLASSPDHAAEYAELKALVAAIPQGPVSMPVDLWPALEQRVAATRRRRPHWSLYAAAATLLLVLGANLARIALPTPEDQPAQVVASAMEQRVAEAQQWAANREFSRALTSLQAVLAENPSDPAAGKAQLALAELEFEHGQRFAEAYAAYNQLKARYPETWTSTPRNADRLDLLAEARGDNFESLYALKSARNGGSEAFAQLERVAAKPDMPLLAALAVDAMRDIVGGPGSTSGQAKLEALETARNRCKDPVAAAQIQLALAETHWKDLNDPQRARDLYGELAVGTQPAVAAAAKAALAKLDTPRP